MADVALGTKGDLAAVTSRRVISFFDTATRHLNTCHYIFRERRDVESRRREVTLKLRHRDRHFAQARDMSAKGEGRAHQVEEDIKAPFQSLYSFSTTIEVDDERSFGSLKDVARLFPDMGKRILDFADDRGR